MRKKQIDYKKDKVNLAYDTLMFEVTRQCNLKCEHCFRGDMQNVIMTKKIIDKALDQIWYVEHIDITGGEPFLAPEIIEYLANSIIKRNLRFMSFTMVVNGTIFGEKAIRSINAINKIATYLFEDLYPKAYKQNNQKYSFEKESAKEMPVSISISTDQFHNNDVEKALLFYRKYANKYVDVKEQDAWEHTLEDGTIETMQEHRSVMNERGLSWVDSEGRAEEYHIGYKKNSCEHCANICHRINMVDGVVKCLTQISANGNVSFGGQLSFENIDKFSMGNILEKPISCMIIDWQWKEPLLCDEIDRMLNLKSILTYNHEIPEIEGLYGNNDTKEVAQQIVDLMLCKREMLKAAHDKFPYLNYEELVEAVDSDININTNGAFAIYMRLWYPNYKEKYAESWKYNQVKEQAICNKYKALNFKRMLGLSQGSTLPYIWDSCDAVRVYDVK